MIATEGRGPGAALSLTKETKEMRKERKSRPTARTLALSIGLHFFHDFGNYFIFL